MLAALHNLQPQTLATEIRYWCGKGEAKPNWWWCWWMGTFHGHWIMPCGRRVWSVGEETSCVSFCPSKSFVKVLGHWKGCGMPGKCQQASFWYLYMRSKHNPPTIAMSCFCQEKSFVTPSSCCSASPAGLAYIALTPCVPACAVRQSGALCKSWQVLLRVNRLWSRLKRCLAVSFSFLSSLFLRAAAAFLCFYSIPGAVGKEEVEAWEEACFLRAVYLSMWKERENRAGKWQGGLNLALLCCLSWCWINSMARLPVWCAFKELLTCKFKSSSSSVLSIKPQRIGDACAFHYVHVNFCNVAYMRFYLWSSFGEVCKTGLVVGEMDALFGMSNLFPSF